MGGGSGGESAGVSEIRGLTSKHGRFPVLGERNTRKIQLQALRAGELSVHPVHPVPLGKNWDVTLLFFLLFYTLLCKVNILRVFIILCNVLGALLLFLSSVNLQLSSPDSCWLC